MLTGRRAVRRRHDLGHDRRDSRPRAGLERAAAHDTPRRSAGCCAVVWKRIASDGSIRQPMHDWRSTMRWRLRSPRSPVLAASRPDRGKPMAIAALAGVAIDRRVCHMGADAAGSRGCRRLRPASRSCRRSPAAERLQSAIATSPSHRTAGISCTAPVGGSDRRRRVDGARDRSTRRAAISPASAHSGYSSPPMVGGSGSSRHTELKKVSITGGPAITLGPSPGRRSARAGATTTRSCSPQTTRAPVCGACRRTAVNRRS